MKPEINQRWYDELQDRWYEADDDPIALLRSEVRFRLPWILGQLERYFGDRRCDILDVGCGAGLLSNGLGAKSHRVVGVDLSSASLRIAQKYDASGHVAYLHMSGDALGFKPESFDVVCCMDVLEHVENPHRVILEIGRVLRKNGIFIFYTFNRTWKSWLFAVKAIDWFFKNAPKHLHVYHLFITPEELKAYAAAAGLRIDTLMGVQPRVFHRSTLKLLVSGIVSPDFTFKATTNLDVGYGGVARKALLNR